MKKYRTLIVLIVVIFLYENSVSYWIYYFGHSAWIISLAYICIFIFAVGYLIYSLVKCFQEKFRDKKQNILTLLLILVILTPLIFSGGLLLKKVLYKGDLLVAYLDGVAGNNGWLTLYGNNSYEFNYGITFLKGKYKVENDTIYFDSPRGENTYNFDCATLWRDKSNLGFEKDSLAYYHMTIVKNILIE